jgi:hypothetical protein
MSFQARLAAIPQCFVEIADDGEPEHFGDAPICIHFEDTTTLYAAYWRLIKGGKVLRDSFDHRQQYGLPDPIDAVATLRAELAGHRCTAVRVDRSTGDLTLTFADDVSLRIFHFGGYEIWHINFPDGDFKYSNYAMDTD